MSDWYTDETRMHVANDLCPYTCMLEECPTPQKLFVTQSAWRDHFIHDHPPQWQCTYCEVDPPPIYKSLSGFITHLMSHDLENTLGRLKELVSTAEIQVMGITECPLCDSKGPRDSPDLVDHVLQHVHDFSLRSLPWPMDSIVSLDKQVGTFRVPPVHATVHEDDDGEHISRVAT